MSKKVSVSVYAELEEWDDTTDVIVWLVGQKYGDVSIPRLELSYMPRAYRHGYENLSSQSADFTGWKEHKKVRVRFEVVNIYDIKEKDEKTGEVYDVEGYRIIVWDKTAQTKMVAVFVVKGSDRDEFKIVKEEHF